MPSSELKPCPFCGEDEEVGSPEGKNYGLFIRETRGPDADGPGHWAYYDVECVRCGCYLSIGAASRDEAIAAWNRRAGEEDGNA